MGRTGNGVPLENRCSLIDAITAGPPQVISIQRDTFIKFIVSSVGSASVAAAANTNARKAKRKRRDEA